MPEDMTPWTRRLEGMKSCRTTAELVKNHGAPAHKVQHGAMEIWHYPLGIVNGTLYSIHVAVAGTEAAQVYMHLEPTSEGRADRRPWWRFWRRTY
jgi:hypothetical protein